MALVYLAGPIDDIARKEAQGWRHEARELLKGLTCFNPCGAFSNCEPVDFGKIVNINRVAISEADCVLVNLTGAGKAIGTIREIEQACTQGKYVVVIVDDSIRRAGLFDVMAVVSSLGEAAEVIHKAHSLGWETGKWDNRI